MDSVVPTTAIVATTWPSVNTGAAMVLVPWPSGELTEKPVERT